jgi:DNA-binding NtrC family response regulator
MPDRTCLIVDDEPAIRTFLRAIFDQRQFHILEADSATHALKIIHMARGCLDLIVSDIRMPGDMDGLDLAHSVRNAFPRIPVILISGYSDKDPGDLAGFEFISKPFAPEAILNAVDRVMTLRPIPAFHAEDHV